MRCLSPLLAALIVLLVVGCSDDNRIVSNITEGVESEPVRNKGKPAELAPSFPISGDFELPESIFHDEVADVYLVSNMGAGDPFALNNNGFVSRVAPDGTVLDLKWIDGATEEVTLHGPFGMTVVGDVLYVVDRDAIRWFDRASGAPLGARDVAGTFDISLLNDICAGPEGTLYFTDTGLTLNEEGAFEPTGTDAIYHLDGNTVSPFLTGAALERPNGCLVNGANVLWTTFVSGAANAVYRTNPSKKQFTVAMLPAGQIDSVVRVDGFLYYSSWEGTAIYRTTLGGSGGVSIREDVTTPGDLGYDAQRDRLLIPSVFGGELIVQPLGR